MAIPYLKFIIKICTLTYTLLLGCVLCSSVLSLQRVIIFYSKFWCFSFKQTGKLTILRLLQ